MTKHQVVDFSLQDIERPSCPNCGTLMWLARITPDRPHHDKRTFECPVCDHAQDIIVKCERGLDLSRGKR
jgi:predicted RNA-binding Zn-ribbon protein involved in translation (DUF1610 family)